MTVTVRRWRSADRAWADTWLAAAAAAAGHDGDVTTAGRTAYVFARDQAPTGVPAGVIVLRRAWPSRREAAIELVVAAPGHARHGAALGAVALLEQALADAGVRRVYAPASESHGISVYFWVRLGYRPLLSDAWPCLRGGVAWLARDLAR